MRRDLTLIHTNVKRYLTLRRARVAYQHGTWRSVLASCSHLHQGIVVVYHRVNKLSKSGFRPTRDLAVHTDDFERHLQFLKQYFTVIPLRVLVDCLHNRQELPVNFAVITFDDGYEDNFTDAYPLLVQYHLPATIFVTVGLLDGMQPLWHDWLEMLLSQTKCRYISMQTKGEKFELPLRTIGEKWYAYEWLTGHIRGLQAAHKTDFLLELGRSLGLESMPAAAPAQRLLRWEEVREMQATALIDIGSHTMHHHPLARIDRPNAEYELGESRRRIVAETRSDTTLFAYPYGARADFTESDIGHLKSLGYLGACTTERQLVTRECDPFHVPRIGAAGMPVEGLIRRIVMVLEQSVQSARVFATGYMPHMLER